MNTVADDYLPKPFDLDELEARLRALIRRGEAQVQEHQQLGELMLHEEASPESIELYIHIVYARNWCRGMSR